MIRLDHWARNLNQEIDHRRAMAFGWGIHDCCISVTDCILAMTGIDVGEGFRYIKDERSALRAFKLYGGVEGIAEFIADKFDIPRISLDRGSSGDVYLFNQSNKRQTLGVLVSSGVVFCAAEPKGWAYLDRFDAIKAWHI